MLGNVENILEEIRPDNKPNRNDIVKLFDLLASFRNAFGETPIFTTNTIVANPHFEKIRESDFKTYHYDKFTQTYNPHHKPTE